MKNKNIKIEYLLMLIYTIETKYLVSINSIRFNEVFTDPDQAIFYTIGKALINGKILYKDIFDHKTPYIYFANALASLLEKNHLGLFIIEVIIMFITLIYVYKISRIYFSNTISIVAAFYIGFILNINSISFGYSRTEAYAIMCLMPAVYIFVKYFEGENIIFNYKSMFVVGILAGITFMTNIRAIILFVPFALALLVKLIINKRNKEILLLFVFGLLGVLASILPYLIYAVVTNSVKDAFYAIVSTNINYAKSTVDTGSGIVETAKILVKEHIAFYMFLLISFISFILLKSNKYLKCSIMASFIIAFIYVTFSNRTYVYYLVILMPFMLSIYYLVIRFFDKKKRDKLNILISTICLALFLVISFVVNKGITNRYINHYRRAVKTNDCAIRYFGDNKDIKVLAYGFLPEVYVYMNKIPDFKYFTTPRLSYNIDSTAYKEQYKYILNKEPDFVVYREENLNTGIPIDMIYQVHSILETSYELLDTIRTNQYEGTFYIYAKKK